METERGILSEKLEDRCKAGVFHLSKWEIFFSYGENILSVGPIKRKK